MKIKHEVWEGVLFSLYSSHLLSLSPSACCFLILLPFFGFSKILETFSSLSIIFKSAKMAVNPIFSFSLPLRLSKSGRNVEKLQTEKESEKKKRNKIPLYLICFITLWKKKMFTQFGAVLTKMERN